MTNDEYLAGSFIRHSSFLPLVKRLFLFHRGGKNAKTHYLASPRWFVISVMTARKQYIRCPATMDYIGTRLVMYQACSPGSIPKRRCLGFDPFPAGITRALDAAVFPPVSRRPT
jgi:hypothetical protein